MSRCFPETAAFWTVGCRLNQADTALLTGRLQEVGCRIEALSDEKEIGIIIVNTCTVTASAAQKSRQAVRRLRRKHPESIIVVTGCSVEIEREFWREEASADIVLPNPEKKRLVEHVGNFLKEQRGADLIFSRPGSDELVFAEAAKAQFPFKSRAFLKVQEGCDNFCTYCIVPYARGPERSRRRDEVIADFKRLLKAGFAEIVLTGVNICAYDDHGFKLVELLRELSAVEGDFRIRLSSTEPHPDNMRLLDVMADNPKICRFLHLSLQHGSDRILKAMNRKYTSAEYAAFAAAARERIPGLHLGTDIIVGFPGETDEDFAVECDFVRKMKFANAHIFTYSKRKGTPAAGFPDQVPRDKAAERYRVLEKITAESAARFVAGHAGRELTVLFERKKAGVAQGWSDNYIAVRCANPAVECNRLTRIEGVEVTADGKLLGKLC